MLILGISPPDLEPFRQEGVLEHIKPLDPDNPHAATPTTGYGNATLVNRAPHPNAAKVYLNWLLSSDGQKAYVESAHQNSRRFDVGGVAETALKRGAKYIDFNKEETVPIKDRAGEIAKEVLK